MLKTYIVQLSQEERQSLQDLVSTGIAAAYKIKHANILLNIDVNGRGWTDEEAAYPVICMDEQPIQLVKETRIPLPAKPGQPESVDYVLRSQWNSQYFYVYRTLVWVA